MPIPTPTITQTSSLVSTVNITSSFTEPVAEFDEDIVVPIRDYYYNKSAKAMVRKGKKRSRDEGGLEASISNQIIWTQQSGDPQVDAVETPTMLGAFTGTNLDAVNTLNREFDKRKEEISRLGEKLDKT